MQILRSKKVKYFLIALACLAFAIPLFGYTYNGSFMRYSGDDFCDTARLVQHGFIGAFRYYYLNEGGRYSAVLLAEIIGVFDPKANGALPGLAIILWLGGLAFTIRMGTKFTPFGPSWLEILLGAEFLVFITLYQAPNLPQVLYWRTGMLAYLIPLIIGTYVLGFVLRQIVQERLSPYALLLIVVITVLAGGFSESAAALNIGFWGLFFIASWVGKMMNIRWASKSIWLSGGALIGSLIAMLIIFTAPGNNVRQLHDNMPRTFNLLTITSMSFRFAWDFIRGSLFGLPVPGALTFVYPILLVVLLVSRQSNSTWSITKHKIVEILMMLVACYLLLMCSVAPSVFAYTRYPELRVLVLARFVMVITMAGVGCLVGCVIVAVLQRLRFKTPHIMVGVFISLMVVSSLYPIYAARRIYHETPLYQKWASFWDTRDQDIRLAKQKGLLDLEVVKIDHIIPWVGELSADPGYWYNICAAQYYRVNKISANQSGWDK